MANQGKTTLQLPNKPSFYDANDGIIFMYGYDSANTSNSVAQTAIMSIVNFANNFANDIQILVQQSDPANSTSLTINEGQLFAYNSYLYIAIANNITRRVSLANF